MSTRENQAFADGKLAFSEGRRAEDCPRRGGKQRAAWMRGYEDGRRLKLAEVITPEERASASDVVRRLKEWAQTL